MNQSALESPTWERRFRPATPAARAARKARYHPTYRVARAALNISKEGLIKIRGRIHACARKVIAPATGDPCVGYELVVRASDSDRKRFAWWIRLARESSCGDFELATEQGLIHVEATGASNLALRKKVTRVASDMAERNAHLVAMLARCGTTVRGHALELQQGIITIGDDVIVWGGDAVEVDPRAPATGYREPPLRRMLTGDQRNPVFVSNLAGANLISQPTLSRRDVLRTILRRRRTDD